MFKSDLKVEVESVMSLKRCVLRDEGTKRGKSPGRGKVTLTSFRMLSVAPQYVNIYIYI